MLDQKFTAEMQAWLSQGDAAPLEEGAMLLLRINGNRRMHQNIVRRGLHKKLVYELKKHLRYRLDGLTRQEAAQAVRRAEATVGSDIASDGQPRPPRAAGKGRRPDHDQLPPKIQALYDRNTELWKKIKKGYNDLLALRDAEPCDRYALCRALMKDDEQYHRNWRRYDTYEAKPAGETEDANAKPAGETPALPDDDEDAQP